MRLFAAAWPPLTVVEVLAGIPRRSSSSIRWTTEDQWHVTLRYFGAFAEAGDLDAALAGLASRFPPCKAVLGPVVRPFGRSLLGVDVKGLDDLAAGVRDATEAALRADPTSKVGSVDNGRGSNGGPPFVGHLTIARARGHANISDHAGDPVAARFDVDEITLVESELRSSGAVYRFLGRYPLGG